MLLRKSICVCIQCFKSVAPRVCIAKVTFLPFFGPNMNIEMGVVIYMYFKHSPDYIDSKYIYWKSKRCGQVGPSPCDSQSEVVYAYKLFDL